MRTLRAAAVLFVASMLTIGCAKSAATSMSGYPITPPKTTVPVSEKIIWRLTETPTPLPMLRLSPGEGARVSLLGASARGPVASVTSATLRGNAPAGATLAVAGRAVEIATTTAFKGRYVVDVKLALEGGGEDVVSFPLLVSDKPMVEFTFTPEAGKTVSKVFVAGSFNGWAGSKNELRKGDDGVFRGAVAIEPGSYTYKMVVDGTWIPDPSNPKTDGSQFNNSLLEVTGRKSEALELFGIGMGMPGAGPQGGVRATGPIDATSVVAIVNNRVLDPSELKVDAAAGTIAFNVAADRWLRENYAHVTVADTQGRKGEITLPLSYADAPRTPRDEVIYFTFTDRFADGDTSLNRPVRNKEVHPLANYMGGDWAGITKKIEEGYFTNLGVTTIWLSPTVKNTPNAEREFPAPHRLYTSYHGYWPIDSHQTNEQFGSMDDLRLLVRAAHERNIAVLMDFVSNHVHRDHPLLEAHPDWVSERMTKDGRDNIRLFDEYPLTTWFDDFIPSLDLETKPAMRAYMTDNAVYWLEMTGADGYRQDAVKHIDVPFWRELTEKLDARFSRGPGGRFVYQVGETISDRSTINRYVAPDLLTGQFDFPLHFALRDVFGTGNAKMEDAGRAVLTSQAEYPVYAVNSPLAGNHDVARFMAYADGKIPPGTNEHELGFTNPPTVTNESSYDKLQLAFAFLMTIPGPPMVYYGDEIGMTGAGDPDNRRFMQWDGYAPGQLRTREALSALAKARAGSVALRRGILQQLFADDERLVYVRTSPEESVLVVLWRKGAPKDATSFALPAWMGQPKGLAPLVTAGANAKVSGGNLEIGSAREYGYGAWRIEY